MKKAYNTPEVEVIAWTLKECSVITNSNELPDFPVELEMIE